MRLLLICLVLNIFCQNTYAQTGPSLRNDVLYVKIKDDLNYRVIDGQLYPGTDRAKVALTILDQLKSLGEWTRSYDVSDQLLQRWRLNAERNLNQSLPDPRQAFRFHLFQPGNRNAAEGLLHQLPDMESVLRIPVPVKDPTPDYTPMQWYKTALSMGIDADSVWTVYHNKGAGVKYCDIEFEFNANHEDLPPVIVLGSPSTTGGIYNQNHATSSIGIVAAKDNGWGTTGIAPEADFYFAAVNSGMIYDISTAITNAMTTLSAGDVILLEQQTGGPNLDSLNPNSQVGVVPVEWFEPYYNAIKLAVGQGIVVVEAGGNGAQDLDDPVYSTGNGGHHPFVTGNNSGAILVGGGSVGVGAGGTDPERAMLSYSNYGSRMDVQGGGEAITTTGYGDLYNAEGPDRWFTKLFGGTSSASPIVAGAAVLVQSVYKNANSGAVLTPDQMRSVLIATGKPQQNGAYPVVNYHIGPLPNAYAAAKEALAHTAIPVVPSGMTVWKLFPNPTSGKFVITFNDTHPSECAIQVCNSAGAVIRNYRLSGKKNLEIDIEDQPSGIYWLRIINGHNVTVKKIVVTH